MFGSEGARFGVRRTRRPLRQLVLAAMLAAVAALLFSGVAMADGWPSVPPGFGSTQQT
jgi:hypothetical protein